MLGKREEAHCAVLGECLLVLEDCLQCAKRPAKALPHQSLRIDRRFSEGQRLILVNDLVALLKQVHRKVGVFGNSVDGIPAAMTRCFRTPAANRAGHHCHDIEQIECAAFKVLAGDVLQRLPARPQVHAVAHLGIARHCSHLRIGEVSDEL